MLLIVKGPPLFDNVTVLAGLGRPTACRPKSRLQGVRRLLDGEIRKPYAAMLLITGLLSVRDIVEVASWPSVE